MVCYRQPVTFYPMFNVTFYLMYHGSVTYPFSRFEDEDLRRLRLLGNVLKKPGTQVLVEAVRLLAHDVFDGRTVDEVVEQMRRGTVFEAKVAAEQPEIYGPKKQQMLFK